MYCRNYTGTVSCVLCREVSYTVSYLGESTIRGSTVYPQQIGLDLDMASIFM